MWGGKVKGPTTPGHRKKRRVVRGSDSYFPSKTPAKTREKKPHQSNEEIGMISGRGVFGDNPGGGARRLVVVRWASSTRASSGGWGESREGGWAAPAWGGSGASAPLQNPRRRALFFIGSGPREVARETSPPCVSIFWGRGPPGGTQRASGGAPGGGGRGGSGLAVGREGGGGSVFRRGGGAPGGMRQSKREGAGIVLVRC